MIKYSECRRAIIVLLNEVTENYQTRSTLKNHHYPYSRSDRHNYHHAARHYHRHARRNQHIRLNSYGSQVTHVYIKRLSAQHRYQHSYTRNMTKSTDTNQNGNGDVSQEGAGSEHQSPVYPSTDRQSCNQQRPQPNPSVGTESAESSNDSKSLPARSKYAPNASRRGGLGNQTWRQPIDLLNQSHNRQDNNGESMVDGAAFGWQRRQRSNYRPPGQRGQSSHGRHRAPRQQTPLKPSEQYIALSQQASALLEEPVPKKLLILDLNGTLVSRTKSRDSMYVRPYQDKFIDYIFRHFDVMVWSSAQPHSVAYMCELFDGRDGELILKWDRTMFGLTRAQYNSKSITIKDLEKVWKALDSKFDASNTVLLDDSPVKAQLQPYNSIHLREFSHTSPTFHNHGESELLHVVRYLDKVRLQSNVCAFMKDSPFVPPDPTQDQDNENLFEVYHYIFGQRARRLVDFRAKEKDDGEVAQVQQLLESTKI